MSEWAKKIFLETLLESSPSLLVAIDPIGSILFVNSATENLFGYSQEELIGKSVETIIPNGFTSIQVKPDESFTAGPRFITSSPGCELFGRRKDGVEFRVEISIAPRLTDRGSVVLATIIAIDNTNFYQHARAEIQMREDLLSVASHELKTPLTSLTMQIQLLNRIAKQNSQTNQSSENLLELASLTEQEIRRFSFLIDNLLDSSRIRAGQLRLNTEAVDLVHLIRGAVHRCQFEIEKSGCSVEMKGDESIIGWWDSSRIEQIVTNLLSNALKYGAGKPVDITVCQDGLKAVLIVRDRGIGISKEDQPRLFNRFERAETSKHYAGLGLGLFIVRQIAEAHGGSIRVESELGHFTSFTVELPLKVTA